MTVRTDDLTSTLGRLLPQEIEAIWLGALLTARFGNDERAESAHKIINALKPIRVVTIDGTVAGPDLETGNRKPASKSLVKHLDVHALRQALSHELKLVIAYNDAKGRATKRTVWPLDVEDYGPNGAMRGSGPINLRNLMTFQPSRSQKLDERRASARLRKGFEIIGGWSFTAQQRGSFARLFQSKPLKTRRFSAGFPFTGKQNLSRQIVQINRS